MYTLTSSDGTRIALDREGTGPSVILIDGALCTRTSGSKTELIRLLAPSLTVYSYDRRGRGDSGDTLPYSVEREVEDIEALVDDAGGSAFLYGHSSGAALAMETAVRLGKKTGKIAMYEAPYNDAPDAMRAWNQYVTRLTELLEAGRRGDAAELFMKFVGTPAAQVEAMRGAPAWKSFEALAPTLAYDHTALLGQDGSVPVERAARVRVPALVMSGSASFPFMHVTAQALGKAMPHAHLRSLEGQTHSVSPAILAPVLVEFFTA